MGNILSYGLGKLFTKHEVPKEYIFTIAHQKDKLNPDTIGDILTSKVCNFMKVIEK